MAVMAFGGFGLEAVSAPPFCEPPIQPAAREFSIPLQDGRIDLSDLLKRIHESLSIRIDEEPVTIDVHSALDQLKLKHVERMTDGAIAFSIEPQKLTVRIDREALAAELNESPQQFKSRAAAVAGQDETRSFGIKMIPDEQGCAETPERLVLLVHGMDDLGFMWGDLIPPLQKADHAVATFDYPNDGSIARSVDLLAEHLKRARRKGVKRIDIVAHSMGGLVARDLLTRPEYYNGDGSGGETWPAVDRLIMIATPNQGATMARYRSVIGLGEQMYRLWNGENVIRTGALDGNGEAGIDLLPNSEFLNDLNRRPLPSHTRITIIAGQIAAVDTGQIAQVLRNWRGDAGDGRATRALEHAVDRVGDGCVPLDSAKLDGVDDFVIVRGNHLSILKSFDLKPAIPSAIPVILNRLQEPSE